MQAQGRWRPPGGILGTIVAQTASRVDELHRSRATLEARARSASSPPPLIDALRHHKVAVIAEVKRRSPSRGEIAGGIEAGTQARAYQRGGARAISVLTEPLHFGGSPADLETVRTQVGIPVLKKDFHLDVLQVLEARSIGASGLLLIVRALEPARLHDLVHAALETGVEPLVEVRDEEELSRALDTGARVIGVNNRNLETLEIDPATAERLVPLVPADRIAIAESGIESHDDVERFARAGADAVLVGSFISAATDPVAAVRDLANVPRVGRAG